MQGRRVFTMIVAVVIAVALLLYLFMYQVRTNEEAIILTFGKPSQARISPGVHFQLPWPIQVVRKFDNRLHVDETLLEQQYTKDQHSVIVSVVMGWRIGDVYLFNQNFGRLGENAIAEAGASLKKIVRDKTNASIGAHNLTDLVSIDPQSLQYDKIEGEALAAARERAAALYGIDLALLKIKRLELPESVRDKVYARMREEREREAREIQSKGESEAADIKNAAEAQARAIRARAQNLANRIKGQGDREAAKHYAVLADNPELAIYLRRLEALEKIAKEETTFVLDTDTPPWDVLKQAPPTVGGMATGQ